MNAAPLLCRPARRVAAARLSCRGAAPVDAPSALRWHSGTVARHPWSSSRTAAPAAADTAVGCASHVRTRRASSAADKGVGARPLAQPAFLQLDGKTALVTGGARGLGRGIALELARCGAGVAVMDLPAQSEGLRETRDMLQRVHDEVASHRDGADALTPVVCTGNIADSDAVKDAVDAAVDEFGGLDVAVACAGINRRGLFAADEDSPGGPKDFRETIDVCLYGTTHTLYHAARQMKAQTLEGKRPGGRLIIIGSVMGSIILGRHSAAYSCAKAGIKQMARVLAGELGEYGITCNVVEPGWMDTPGERVWATEDELAAFGRRIPAGRIGVPEDIAHACAYLASDGAAFVTGASLLVDGGFSVAMEVQPNPWAQGDNVSLKSS